MNHFTWFQKILFVLYVIAVIVLTLDIFIWEK